MSMGFLVEDGAPIVWRGLMVRIEDLVSKETVCCVGGKVKH